MFKILYFNPQIILYCNLLKPLKIQLCWNYQQLNWDWQC